MNIDNFKSLRQQWRDTAAMFDIREPDDVLKWDRERTLFLLGVSAVFILTTGLAKEDPQKLMAQLERLKIQLSEMLEEGAEACRKEER